MSIIYSRKYFFNEKFFLKWSSEMAYVLGYWFADGYMTSDKSYRVAFFSVDKEHLQNISITLAYEAPVRRFNRNGKPGSIYNLTFRSKNFFNSLKLLGGMSRKSFTMEFPKIPGIFLADFIRGYFDGDGSVHLVRYTRTKDRKRQIDLRSSFTSGSNKFLFKLRDVLTKFPGLTPKKVYSYANKKYPKNNHWKLSYGTKDTLKLLKFMYYGGCPLYLDRKYAIYQKYLKNLISHE